MKVRIEHVALYVKDIEEVKSFYVKYFGAKSNGLYQNEEGFSSYFLTFDTGARLEIMAHTLLEHREVKELVNGFNHLAFSVGSKEEVLRLTQEIVKDGHKLLSSPRDTGDGYFESCIADPEGNRIEITV